MKRILFGAFLVLAAFFVMTSVSLAAEVAQGKVLSVDKTSNTVTIEEFDTHKSPEHPYGRPTGVTSEYEIVKETLIGIPPQPGDVIRIAFRTQNTERIAVRIMNVSKQDLKKK